MNEYLVLLRLNPGKIVDILGAIRNLPETPVPGVDVRYSMNIFGAWDVGLWINADNASQALEFVQKRVRDMPGVTEVYTVPTFPHRNTVKGNERQTTREVQKVPLGT